MKGGESIEITEADSDLDSRNDRPIWRNPRILLAVAGLALPVICSVVCYLARDVPTLWQTWQQTAMQREQREEERQKTLWQTTPTLEPYLYVAESCDFSANGDRELIEGRELTARPIATRFWLSECGQTEVDVEKLYVFILIVNRGEGRAEGLQIVDTEWVPKESSQVPDGWTEMGPLGVLDRREFYALLVDTLTEEPDFSNLSDLSDLVDSLPGAHFKDVAFTVEYRDALGNECQPLPVSASELGWFQLLEP